MARIDRKALIKFKYDILQEEYAKLVALPDKEFLEAADKRNELRQKILAIIKDMNKPEHVSKYFAKHYEVEEADLYERECGRCKKIFGIDYKWLDYFTMDGDPDWVRCTCPYCGKKLQWHI